MWRAFFLALGVATCILGAECLVVDHFVMAGEPAPHAPTVRALHGISADQGTASEMIPPEWAPWSLMSTGAVIILYALTINRGGS